MSHLGISSLFNFHNIFKNINSTCSISLMAQDQSFKILFNKLDFSFISILSNSSIVLHKLDWSRLCFQGQPCHGLCTIWEELPLLFGFNVFHVKISVTCGIVNCERGKNTIKGTTQMSEHSLKNTFLHVWKFTSET